MNEVSKVLKACQRLEPYLRRLVDVRVTFTHVHRTRYYVTNTSHPIWKKANPRILKPSAKDSNRDLYSATLSP